MTAPAAPGSAADSRPGPRNADPDRERAMELLSPDGGERRPDAAAVAPRDVASAAALSESALAATRGPDRRQRRTPRFSRYMITGGRRRHVRRTEEREGAFVDAYDPILLFGLLWIAFMNAGDSFFTLVHLQNGGTEVNPVAAMLLGTGRTGFVLLKSGVIAAALCVLCVHKNFHIARIGMWTAAAAYTLLFAYHLALFAF